MWHFLRLSGFVVSSYFLCEIACIILFSPVQILISSASFVQRQPLRSQTRMKSIRIPLMRTLGSKETRLLICCLLFDASRAETAALASAADVALDSMLATRSWSSLDVRAEMAALASTADLTFDSKLAIRS